MQQPDRYGTPAPATPQAAAAPTPPRTGPLQWFARGGWYVFVVVLSLGMLSFVPFVHAALRTRRPPMWLWAVLYTAAVVTLFALTDRLDVGGFVLGLMVIASVHSLVLRTQVWRPADPRRPGHPRVDAAAPANDPAIAAVLAARARREEARRLAANDPQMARELRIGRPDLPRHYDDGGLVDLNSAPAQVIADVCGIEPAVATLITDSRSRAITFTAVDDVFSFADIPFPLWDRIRDRALVITG